MQIFGVEEVGAYIREMFELDDNLADLWVTGEITNFSRSPSGHYYFCLKDATSQLRAVLFRGNAARCGASPRPGDAVVAHGRIDFYQPQGSLQLVVDLLYPAGVGEAHLRFEALRLKLEQEGLFAEERKRPLPPFPRRIGLVTSEGGAVLHDVVNVLSRRYPLVEVVLSHTSVQGDGAPAEIVLALLRLREWTAADGSGVDAVIVARGGGSPEDLACFNDERVARAIFASPWPVVSAVGHETDVTICDFVADLRAPTPSAAAELVAPDLETLRQAVAELVGRGRGCVAQALGEARTELRHARNRLVARSPLAQIAAQRQATDDYAERLRTATLSELRMLREQIEGRRLQLGALSPRATLARGYSIVSRRGDGVVRSIGDVGAQQPLTIQVTDGEIEATATDVRPRDSAAKAFTPRPRTDPHPPAPARTPGIGGGE
ncbi:MAG: exodeoxyribonuclease VII large subunit [Chloroflexota bacterium]|nr:exodeoxyribonuclease VII large subunit [Chloroflexota bacterium]